MKKYCRYLRANQTNVENIFWQHLRNRQFFGLKFRRQVAIGPYIVDFFCYEKNLVVEFDGGQHNMSGVRAYDRKRTAYLIHRGFRVIRFWNHEALKHKEVVLEEIRRAALEIPSPEKTTVFPTSPRGRGASSRGN